jgi:phosphoenolpyruvate synthase/pyruvate phosphate dikinase
MDSLRVSAAEAPFVRTLSSVTVADAGQCGMKAAVLGELAARGYAVPRALIITTAAYGAVVAQPCLAERVERYARESPGAGPADMQQTETKMARAFTSATLPAQVTDAVCECVSQSNGRLAVRSSANHEDLQGASFAGAYNSFLDVEPKDVPQAILACYASLFSARASAYRRRKHVSEVGAMGVIVQEMLHCDHAGVVFTRAPQRPDTVLIECAPSRGDAVVSGTVSPNRYYINRTTLYVEESLQRYLVDTADIQRVAREALRIEDDFGMPQDVEYGVVDGRVHVLQARPVTTPHAPLQVNGTAPCLAHVARQDSFIR